MRHLKRRADLSLSFILFIAVPKYRAIQGDGVVMLTPSLYASLGIFLPLIAVNCAIMGAGATTYQPLVRVIRKYIDDIWDALSGALGSGIDCGCWLS